MIYPRGRFFLGFLTQNSPKKKMRDVSTQTNVSIFDMKFEQARNFISNFSAKTFQKSLHRLQSTDTYIPDRLQSTDTSASVLLHLSEVRGQIGAELEERDPERLDVRMSSHEVEAAHRHAGVRKGLHVAPDALRREAGHLQTGRNYAILTICISAKNVKKK
jgi:hypothetical protein